MLPSWHNRLYIAVSPERISMIMLGRGLKPVLVAKVDEVVTPGDSLPPWQAALDRLTELLGQPEWQKADVHVVLSNRLAKFAAFKFGQQLKSYPAQEAFAKHMLSQVYGSMVEHWILRIQHSKRDSVGLICAIDQRLLEGLQLGCATSRLSLKSVTPFLTSVFNRTQKMLMLGQAWLVIHEPGYSLLVLLSEGEVNAVQGVYHDDFDELPMMLDRENLVCALAEPCKSVYLYAPSYQHSPASAGRGYELTKLDWVAQAGFPAPSEGLYAMAMSGMQR